MHFTAHEYAVTFVKWKQGGQVRIRQQSAVSSYKRFNQRCAAAHLHIHQEKSYFRGEIATTKLGTEFDAIEDLNPLGSEADVLAVKIAVHIANPPLSCSTNEQVMVAMNKACSQILKHC